MQQQFTYQSLLKTSQRINWRVDDLVGGDKHFDFSKPFLPETFVRAERLAFLNPKERLTLNHIRSRGYLALFELVEAFIMPFIDQQADVAAVVGYSKALVEMDRATGGTLEANGIEYLDALSGNIKKTPVTPFTLRGPNKEVR